MPTKRPNRDALDDSLEIWAREIPDLDPLTEGIIERIQILAWNVNQSMDETLETFDLDRRSFSLLGKLRKHGPPYRVSAGKLATDLRLSSGAMTNRLDRMEAAGLIRRLPDPDRPSRHARRADRARARAVGQDRRRAGAPRGEFSSVLTRRREGAAPRPAPAPDARVPGLEAQEARGPARPKPARRPRPQRCSRAELRRVAPREEFAEDGEPSMDVLERGRQRREADADRVRGAVVGDDVALDERAGEALRVRVADRDVGAATGCVAR